MTSEMIFASKYQKILTNQSARYTIETSKREKKPADEVPGICSSRKQQKKSLRKGGESDGTLSLKKSDNAE